MAKGDDRRSSRQGASASAQVPGEADRQSHRHDGRFPARWSAWVGQGAARVDRRLRALDPRVSVKRSVALLLTLLLAACGRGQQAQNGPTAANNASAASANQAGVT